MPASRDRFKRHRRGVSMPRGDHSDLIYFKVLYTMRGLLSIAFTLKLILFRTYKKRGNGKNRSRAIYRPRFSRRRYLLVLLARGVTSVEHSVRLAAAGFTEIFGVKLLDGRILVRFAQREILVFVIEHLGTQLLKVDTVAH